MALNVPQESGPLPSLYSFEELFFNYLGYENLVRKSVKKTG